MVGLHREDEAFLWHLQVSILEAAGEHIGALDQGGHFVQQGVVVDRVHVMASVGCRSFQLAGNFGPTCLEARNHRPFFFKLRHIGVSVVQHHGIDLRFKTMPLRVSTR